MRLTFKDKQINLRDAYLSQDEELYSTLPYGAFKKVKDWDNNGPTVIWEGKINSPELLHTYKVQIHYSRAYPYRRPNVYPLIPRIINQRHQMPTKGKTELPGALCLLPHNPDRWVVGMTCIDLIERAITWFKAFELGTLEDEFAPPEIERFFPVDNQLKEPSLILVDSLLKTKPGARRGGCLIIPTVSGKFAFFDVFGELDTEASTQELSRLLGLILPEESISKSGWIIGEWFELDNEPPMPVPVNSANFLALLNDSGREWSEIQSIVRLNPKIVALKYPTSSGHHWLIFQSKFIYPNRSGFKPTSFSTKIYEVNKLNRLNLYGAYHINTETIFKRVSGYEVGKLQKKSCLVLGCGTIGSRVAELLIKSGVGTIRLVDKDQMRAGNVCRHVLGLDVIGEKKATALKRFLHKRNPDAKIGTYTEDIVFAPEVLSKMVEDSNVIVSCMGNDASELFASSAAITAQKPIIFCRSYLQGRLGEIFISHPMQFPACFKCASLYLNAPDCKIPRPPEIPYKDLVGLDEDCGSAFIPASAVDLDLISLHSARAALSLLQDVNLSANYWLIRGREFNSDEYQTFTGEIREPFQQHSFQIQPQNNCDICRINMES